MTTAQRWTNLSAGLTRRIEGVPEGRWESPAPPEGWVARDVVRHLVEWMPSLYFPAVGLPVPPIPSADADPAGAWHAADEAIRALLADPDLAGRPTSTRAGDMTLEALIAMTGLMDLLVHTWDLARATGQDETLDREEASASWPASSRGTPPCAAAGTTARASPSPTTPTSRPGCWPSPAAGPDPVAPMSSGAGGGQPVVDTEEEPWSSC